MNDFSTYLILPEIRENLHRSSKGIALPGSQQVKGAVGFLPQCVKQSFEDAFRSTCSYVDEVERVASIISVVAASKQIVNTKTAKEFSGNSIDGLLVVKLGCQCIYIAARLVGMKPRCTRGVASFDSRLPQ